MIEKIGTVIGLLIGVFSFGYLKGKQNEKNKSNKRTIKTMVKAKTTRQRIKKIAPDKLDDEYDKLLAKLDL